LISKIKESFFELKQMNRLVLCGLCVALYIVLSILTINISPTLQPSLNFVALLVCAAICGPVPAALVGIAGDILGWFVSPKGAYFPGFTLSACLLGLFYGLIFYRERITLLRALLAAFFSNLLFTFCLTGVWLYVMYKTPLIGLLTGRLIRVGVTFPVEFLLMFFLLPAVLRIRKRQ